MIMGMKTFKNLLIPLGTLILALVIIGGAAYAYEKEVVKNDQATSIITSAQDQFRQKTAEEQRLAALSQAEASLNAATARLAQLRAYLSPVAALADAYDSLNKDASTLSVASAKITGPQSAEFTKANQGLADTLQAFKILLSSIPPSGATNFQISQAEQFSKQAQSYINQINSLGESLTPSNSGLSQNEINTFQATASTVSDGATKTSNDLATALPVPPVASNSTDQTPYSGGNTTSNGNTTTDTTSTVSANTTGSTTNTTSTVTASDVAAQQQIVDQLQNQVDQLQQQSNDSSGDTDVRTADPGTLDTENRPALQVDQFGRPILIQGTNSDIYRGNQ